MIQKRQQFVLTIQKECIVKYLKLGHCKYVHFDLDNVRKRHFLMWC